MISQQRREELKRLTEAATCAERLSHNGHAIIAAQGTHTDGTSRIMCLRPKCDEQWERDSAFILAARRDLPALLADLTAVERELAQSNATIERLQSQATVAMAQVERERDELREQLAVLQKGAGA